MTKDFSHMKTTDFPCSMDSVIMTELTETTQFEPNTSNIQEMISYSSEHHQSSTKPGLPKKTQMNVRSITCHLSETSPKMSMSKSAVSLSEGSRGYPVVPQRGSRATSHGVTSRVPMLSSNALASPSAQGVTHMTSPAACGYSVTSRADIATVSGLTMAVQSPGLVTIVTEETAQRKPKRRGRRPSPPPRR